MREYNKPIMIIDGLNVFMRHYIANPTMSDEGYHVGGVVGFGVKSQAVQLLLKSAANS